MGVSNINLQNLAWVLISEVSSDIVDSQLEKTQKIFYQFKDETLPDREQFFSLLFNSKEEPVVSSNFYKNEKVVNFAEYKKTPTIQKVARFAALLLVGGVSGLAAGAVFGGAMGYTVMGLRGAALIRFIRLAAIIEGVSGLFRGVIAEPSLQKAFQVLKVKVVGLVFDSADFLFCITNNLQENFKESAFLERIFKFHKEIIKQNPEESLAKLLNQKYQEFVSIFERNGAYTKCNIVDFFIETSPTYIKVLNKDLYDFLEKNILLADFSKISKEIKKTDEDKLEKFEQIIQDSLLKKAVIDFYKDKGAELKQAPKKEISLLLRDFRETCILKVAEFIELFAIQSLRMKGKVVLSAYKWC